MLNSIKYLLALPVALGSLIVILVSCTFMFVVSCSCWLFTMGQRKHLSGQVKPIRFSQRKAVNFGYTKLDRVA